MFMFFSYNVLENQKFQLTQLSSVHNFSKLSKTTEENINESS